MRPRGGIIGASTAPTATSASGIWTLREAESYTRGATWPALPGAPTSVSGTTGVASVALTWTPPAQTGGLSLTDYVIQYSSDSGTTWTTFNDGTATATNATITGLTNGTAYIFRVAALNIAGAGNYSAVSAVVTPAAAVIPDLTLTTAAGVTWSGTGTSAAPYAYAAGLADYVVAGRNGSNDVVSGGANRLKFTAVKKGALYFSTAYYDRADDNSSSIIILRNGSSVYSPGNINGATSTFSTNFSVNPGDVITFDTNRGYWTSGGTLTNTSVYLAPYAIIGDPTNVSVTGGNAQASLSWTAPSSNANLITDYTIQYSVDGGTLWITWAHTASAATSATVTGLYNGVGHLFRVKAIGTTGQDSGYANASSVTPSGAANSSAINQYYILNYTSGTWTGSGSAASPFASSSVYSGSGTATYLPFKFYALVDCEITVSMLQTATYDDNHSSQTVYYYINGANTPHTQISTGASTSTPARTMFLFAGETLNIYVAGGNNYDNTTDNYRNISVSGVALRSSPLEIFAKKTSMGTWTGTGTVADPFTGPTTLTYSMYTGQGTMANGINFRAIRSGTISFSASLQNIPDDNGADIHLWQHSPSVNGPNLTEGQTGTRTMAMERHRVYQLWINGGNEVYNAKVWGAT
ncbi:fibronectin type III domain-containing protein [Sphingorhabdus sp.]|uniref:fibronectin type III domain-containing protein n=1 Tax=Sphingorhabdus sp. TaxID=1902408 RepID=UPI003340A175